MSSSYIPATTRFLLWGRAAGRCQYRGCAAQLWLDETTKTEFNSGYVAHIVADSPKGPRGDAVRSDLLKKDISNLMLLCDVHHRKIDVAEVPEHPEALLLSMKAEHEQRVTLVTSISHDKSSDILLYGAIIGEQTRLPRAEEARVALLPEWYPARYEPITLSLRNSRTTDRTPTYWNGESEQLRRAFETDVRSALRDGRIKHLSVFALAPQPLLILLGTLLSDQEPAQVYQLHREPATWQWLTDEEEQAFELTEPENKAGPAALVLAVSATVTPDRIGAVLGDTASVWTLTVQSPHNDVLKTRRQLQQFRETMRRAFNRIKEVHGQGATLHVFPAAPVAVNVELGRVWMPKADMPLRVYDQVTPTGPFVRALEIPTA